MIVFCRNLSFATFAMLVVVLLVSAVYPIRSALYYGLLSGTMGGAVGMAILVWHLTSLNLEEPRRSSSHLVYGYVRWRCSMHVIAGAIVMATIHIFRSLDPFVILIVSAISAGVSTSSLVTLLFALFQRDEDF